MAAPVRQGALLLLGIAFVVYGLVQDELTWATIGAFVAMAAVLPPRLTALTVGGASIELVEQRARDEQDALVEDLRKVEGIPDFPTLLDFNVRQMRVYQDLSTGQARSSYRRSQAAFGVGLALIAAAVLLAFIGNDTATKIAASGAAGLGGGLSAYISRTYLKVYERTLDQLNFYYRQPLVNSYLLTAERLIMYSMPHGQRDAAFERLLDEVLRSARSLDLAPARTAAPPHPTASPPSEDAPPTT
jgi:hypothetical protein